jgi:transcriptional regulator GlxA family with amidase domain
VAGHFEEPLDVPALAAAACLSPKHFSRKFKTALHLTPMEYLRNYRLRHAQDMLTSSDATVSQIAWKCGFADPAHFSRAFKQQYGVSPLIFRDSFRSLVAQDEHSHPSSSRK